MVAKRRKIMNRYFQREPDCLELLNLGLKQYILQKALMSYFLH